MKRLKQEIEVLILEDEKIYTNRLVHNVLKVFPNAHIKISSNAFNVSDSLPDLAILDIGLKGKMDGISFMKAYGQQIPAILFYSVCIHRIKESFGNNVLGFIEKDEDEAILLAKLQQAKSVIERLQRIWLLDVNKREIAVRPENICLISRKDRIFWLMDIAGNCYRTVSGGLEECSDWIDERFVKINQSEFVNREQIARLEKEKIVLNGGTTCYMSRRMRKDAERRIKG